MESELSRVSHTKLVRMPKACFRTAVALECGMETSSPQKMEVFRPFGAALDLTKLILFQPFDLGKWCVIGFAAFLAFLGGGSGGNGFNYTSKAGKGDWKFSSSTHDFADTVHHLPGWLLPLLVVIFALVVVALIVLCAWLSARGKFIFTDCIVRNRAAIVEPWKEYKREGNSYFLFSLLAMLLLLLAIGVLSLPLWLPWAFRGHFPHGALLLVELIVCGSLALSAAVTLGAITSFMVPIMYRQRCRAGEAFRKSLALILSEPWPVVLYLLFVCVLWIAFVLLSCLTTCLTCCMAAIPYVGTVILLPGYVLFQSYRLLFVRQFGADYDAWGNLVAIESAAPPVEPPPESPSSTEPPALPA